MKRSNIRALLWGIGWGFIVVAGVSICVGMACETDLVIYAGALLSAGALLCFIAGLIGKD